MIENIDFSLNTNFIKPNVAIDLNHLDIVNHSSEDTLYENIGKLYKIKNGELELFNSKSGALFSLLRNLKLQNCVIYIPSDLEYIKMATLFGYQVQTINRFNTLDEQIIENSLVIFANPSIPDGTYYNLETLFALWTKVNATIVIDESFLDFTNGKSAIEFIKCYPKLYILKSLEQFYGNYGVKIHGIISNKMAVSNLKLNEPFSKISQFDGYYLNEALKDKSFKKVAKALNTKNNILLEQILINSNLFEKVYPSSTNFILGKLSNLKGNQLQQYLEKYKILISDCSHFDGLDDSYIRFTVKSTKDLEELEKALKDYNT